MNITRGVSIWVALLLSATTPFSAAADLIDTAPSTQLSADQAVSAMFRQGQADRQQWETWFAAQSGDYLAGATYWASHRSIAGRAGCSGPDSPTTGAAWTEGCSSALQRLAASDQLRKTQPDYRLGWNSISSPPDSAAPSSVTSEQPMAQGVPASSQSPATPQSASTQNPPAIDDTALAAQSDPGVPARSKDNVATAAGAVVIFLLTILFLASIPAVVVFLIIKMGKPAEDQIRTLLVEGEEIRVMALQRRIAALFHRREVSAATTGRFIHLRRRLFGGYTMFDMRWQDIKDAKLTVGMLTSTIGLAYSANLSDTAMNEGDTRRIAASGLTTASAQALYRECQREEQSWREKRRVRSIEEMRAKAGGVQIATGVYPSGPVISDKPVELPRRPVGPGDNLAGRLAEAKELRTQGLVTDSEYEAMKARIIGSI